MLARFLSRKFLLAAFVSGVASVAVFTGHLTGSEWIAAESLVFGLYGASNVAAKKAT